MRLADSLYKMSIGWLQAAPKTRAKFLHDAKSQIIRQFTASVSESKTPIPRLRDYPLFGDRLRALREGKNLSQGDVEARTGLLRCYISRVENSHTVPAIETLEKLARAMEVPLYQLFYDGEEPPKVPKLSEQPVVHLWGSSKKDAPFLSKLRRLLARMNEGDRKLLLYTAQKMAGPRTKRTSRATAGHSIVD